MTDTTQGGAGGPATAAKDMASKAMDTLAHDATQLASQAQQKAHGALEQQKQTATDTLEDFASAIRKAGDELAGRDQSMAGRVVRHAADSLEQLSRSLADKRPSELLDAARDFGRRNPVAFAGGAVLLGIALGRFARSSGSHDEGGSAYAGATRAGGYGADGESYGAGLGGSAGSGVGAEAWASTSGQSLPGGVSTSPEAAYDSTLTSATGASGGTSGAGALGDFATAGGSAPQDGAALGGGGVNRSGKP